MFEFLIILYVAQLLFVPFFDKNFKLIYKFIGVVPFIGIIPITYYAYLREKRCQIIDMIINHISEDMYAPYSISILVITFSKNRLSYFPINLNYDTFSKFTTDEKYKSRLNQSELFWIKYCDDYYGTNKLKIRYLEYIKTLQ